MKHWILAALILFTLPLSVTEYWTYPIRKLLSLTCIASLLFTLVSPTFAESPPIGTQQATSWGLLKTRYGGQDVVERPDIWKAVSDAITSSSVFNDASVRYVLKMGLPEQGYLGIGFVGTDGVFGAVVDGNFTLRRTVWFDQLSESSVLQNEWADGVFSTSIITEADFDLNESSFSRTDLHTYTSLARTYGCMFIAGVAGDLAGIVAGIASKNPGAIYPGSERRKSLGFCCLH